VINQTNKQVTGDSVQNSCCS